MAQARFKIGDKVRFFRDRVKGIEHGTWVGVSPELLTINHVRLGNGYVDGVNSQAVFRYRTMESSWTYIDDWLELDEEFKILELFNKLNKENDE